MGLGRVSSRNRRRAMQTEKAWRNDAIAKVVELAREVGFARLWKERANDLTLAYLVLRGIEGIEVDVADWLEANPGFYVPDLMDCAYHWWKRVCGC